MPAEFDIRPMVEKYSFIPSDRLRIVQTYDAVQLANIRRGVVFIFAAWSGPSVMGFRRFTQIIKPFVAEPLHLVVLDNDCLTAAAAKELFGGGSFIPGGWGEAIWIRDGKVVAREFTHKASEGSMIEHTRALIDGGGA